MRGTKRRILILGSMTCITVYGLLMQKAWAGTGGRYSTEKVALDSRWKYAGESVIHSGRAVLYKASGKRKKYTVGVNAGHGTKGGGKVYTYCHPDRSPKVTGGTTAKGEVKAAAVSEGMTFVDGTEEAEANLKVASAFKEKLLQKGYDVLMVRDGQDVQLDNVARTVICNNMADCHIAIHFESNGSKSDNGCFYLSVPDALKNMYPVSATWRKSEALGESLIEALSGNGVPVFGSGSVDIDLTQTSYSTVPSVDIELGNEYTVLSDKQIETYVEGLAAGVDSYVGQLDLKEASTDSTKEKTGKASEVASGETIPFWEEDSSSLRALVEYVEGAVDPESDDFVEEEDRIAVFDFDGTLYGERFPTNFEHCLFLYRVLHDSSYKAADDVREYAAALETAVKGRKEEPDGPRSADQMTAEVFKGFTTEEYRDYVRKFMDQPAYGFEGMTYKEAFYKPMAALVRYLNDHDFTIFVSSDSERSCVRELMKGSLDDLIPPDRVIGSAFSLAASGQGEEEGSSYTLQSDDSVVMEGNLEVKNQKANKVFSIINEIGRTPALVFGNSSGDLAMASYTVQNGGRAFMVLCDDTDREYGDPEVVKTFREECKDYELISMKDDFRTIYGENVVKKGAD